MPSNDLISVIIWWIVLFIISLGFLPLTIRLFHNFFDRGYIFSKMLGTAIVSYVILTVGLAHLVPFNRLSAIIITIFVIAAINGLLIYYNSLRAVRQSLVSSLQSCGKWFIAEELLFLM